VRIRTATFKVQSLEDLEKRFASHGVTLVPGDREGQLATDPATHLGVMMQFTE
jgi:hypothetical protein